MVAVTAVEMSELCGIVLKFIEEGNNLYKHTGNLSDCKMIRGRRRKI